MSHIVIIYTVLGLFIYYYRVAYKYYKTDLCTMILFYKLRKFNFKNTNNIGDIVFIKLYASIYSPLLLKINSVELFLPAVL